MNTYVYDTYVDPLNAIFKRDMWNCYAVEDRTTNACESYHHFLNIQFKHKHPDPFAFIEFLKSEEATIERRILQLQAGAAMRKRKREYQAVYDALTRLRNNITSVLYQLCSSAAIHGCHRKSSLQHHSLNGARWNHLTIRITVIKTKKLIRSHD